MEGRNRLYHRVHTCVEPKIDWMVCSVEKGVQQTDGAWHREMLLYINMIQEDTEKVDFGSYLGHVGPLQLSNTHWQYGFGCMIYKSGNFMGAQARFLWL